MSSCLNILRSLLDRLWLWFDTTVEGDLHDALLFSSHISEKSLSHFDAVFMPSCASWCLHLLADAWHLSLTFLTVFQVTENTSGWAFFRVVFYFECGYWGPQRRRSSHLGCILWRRARFSPKGFFKKQDCLGFSVFSISLLHATELPEVVFYFFTSSRWTAPVLLFRV